MIKNVVSAIGGVSGYGLVSLILFFVFFSSVLVWAWRLKTTYLNAMRELPLESEVPPDSTPESVSARRSLAEPPLDRPSSCRDRARNLAATRDRPDGERARKEFTHE